MFVIRDLMWKLGNLPKFPLPDSDPLRTEDGFYEAILVDVYYVPLMASILLLFDLRTSLMFDDSCNTAILICEQVVKLNISETIDNKIWNVGTSKLHSYKQSVQIDLTDLLVDRRINIDTGKVYYFEGVVEGIGGCSDAIEWDNLAPYLNTTPSLNSGIKISSMSSLFVEG